MEKDIAFLVAIALFIPLLGFITLISTSKFISRTFSGLIGCSTIFVSFAFFASFFFTYLTDDIEGISYTYFRWIHFNEINADFTLRLDHLSMLMTLIITGIGFLIHVYSVGYMNEDEEHARFFAYLNFFIFAMLLLVLANNLLLLFVGWEGVGLASYLLIGFWHQKPTASAAAIKAFVVNRVGDLGLLLGIILTFHQFGTSDINEISRRIPLEFAYGAPLLNLIGLLYFIGATGKSAQIPLQTWLPDAMEGPTPVSALIHAATMVTAGVYLLVRMNALFSLAPETLFIIGTVGAVTSLYAACCAVGQTDLKRVLAYSTVSQLGLMFLACGAGAYYSAMFHLTTHAFIKALLFLSAGNVVHMLAGETQMAKMGGLSRLLPKTNVLFLIGVLALSGLPPFAAFFSKDEILAQEHLAGFDILYGIGLGASILTGFYLMRAYCISFTGAPRLDAKVASHVHEAPKVMLIPESILAFFAVFGGLFGLALFGQPTAKGTIHPLLERFLSAIPLSPFEEEVFHDGFITFETLIAVVGAILGVALSAYLYTRVIKAHDHPPAILKRSFYIDEIYNGFFVRPLKAVSTLIADFLEPKVLYKSITGSAKTTYEIASGLQLVQSGQIRSYIGWMALGMAVLLVYLLI